MSKGRATVAKFNYADLLVEVKSRIQVGQTRAISAANVELVRLYWDIGRMIDSRQKMEGYGTGVIPRLARDLHNELPALKGFSERNIGRMLAFSRAYQNAIEVLPQAVAKLPPSAGSADLPHPVANTPRTDAQFDLSCLWLVPWGHHALLLERVKDVSDRFWYMQQTVAQGLSRNALSLMIKSHAAKRQGKLINNFELRLPSSQSDLAQQSLKDPYIFDFLTLSEPFVERELETGLLQHLERFLIELGRGFAFVGRQYRIEVGDEDYYIDLLFYHLKLRCFVVIDLKRGAFKVEYAGKMNFYLNVVNDLLRHNSDAPAIGLILCQEKNRIAAEYALQGMQNPIGVSEYELTRALPFDLQSSLPTIESIEEELSPAHSRKKSTAKKKKTSDKNRSVTKVKRRNSRSGADAPNK